MPRQDVVNVERKKLNKSVKLNKRLFSSLFWREGAGQANKVMARYTRPTGVNNTGAILPVSSL